MDEYADFFKMLGDITRLRIINLLIQAEEKLCVCEIVEALHLPQYRISKSLTLLRYAKIVDVTPDGTWSYYGLNPEISIFYRDLFDLMKKQFKDVFSSDLRQVRSRLALRENGRCVIGFKEVK